VTGAFGFVASAAAGFGWRSFAAGLAGPRGAGDPLSARSSSSTKRRTVRTRWGTEMSTPRSLKICATRYCAPLRSLPCTVSMHRSWAAFDNGGLQRFARPHRALRSRPRRRPRPRIRPRGVMEYWPARIATRSAAGGSVECCANSELHPRSGLAT
jgi:hypothetical protein